MPPIRIHCATELRAIGNNLSHTGDYQLAGDIVLDSAWSPITRGDNIILDGDGHRIGPLNAPLFESLTDATVFELALEMDIKDGGDAVGGLCRTAHKCALQDVSMYGSIRGTGNTGAIAGELTDCTIERCQQYSLVNGCGGTGGVAGTAKGCQFIDCHNMNGVHACSGAAGGVVGMMSGDGLCQGCVNEGAVVTQGARAGGVIGQAVSHGGERAIIIVDCRNMGEITAGADSGGIAGAALGECVTIESCVSLAVVSSQGACAGGICGRIDGGAQLLSNKACVKTSAQTCCAGGIAGSAEGAATITGSMVDGAYVRASHGAGRILGAPPPNRDDIILNNNKAASRVRICRDFGEACSSVPPNDMECRAAGLHGETFDCPEGMEARECFECADKDVDKDIDKDIEWEDAIKGMLRDIIP